MQKPNNGATMAIFEGILAGMARQARVAGKPKGEGKPVTQAEVDGLQAEVEQLQAKFEAASQKVAQKLAASMSDELRAEAEALQELRVAVIVQTRSLAAKKAWLTRGPSKKPKAG